MELEDDRDRAVGVRKPKRNHLISRKKFREFKTDHPGSAKDYGTFMRWCKVIEQAVWTDFASVRATFSTADQVKDFVIFNVGGNKYRIVTRIDYQYATIFIRHVLTHAQYEKGRWKSES